MNNSQIAGEYTAKGGESRGAYKRQYRDDTQHRLRLWGQNRDHGCGASFARRGGPEEINELSLKEYLYAPEIPAPDLIICTGGEMRLSNFLLWQAAYSELYFTDALWPDFNRTEIDKALAAYAGRQRRFGRR